MDTVLPPPFFSIILPVFNAEKFISETITSILQQTFTDWELIIINDGSTDNSASIVEEFCKNDKRIKLIQQENKKQAAARNTGLKEILGEWVAFIDADDMWLPTKLELQHEYIYNHPEVDVVFTDGYTKFHDKRIRNYYHYEIVHGFFYGADLYKIMLFGNYIPILSVVVKRGWISKVGPQDETVPGVEDHDYWLRLCRAGANFYGMDERLFVYNVHETNFSADLINQNYISSRIRIKNFDPALLDKKKTKKFTRAFGKYIKYFKQQGRPELAQDLTERFKKLNIPAVPAGEQMSDIFFELIRRAKFYFNLFLQKCSYFLIKIFYFYPKRKYSRYANRLNTFYTKWLNFRNINSSVSINLSSSAKINFFDKKGSRLNVQSIYVGDYSIINFVEESSSIIGGADIKIGKFCNLNIVGTLVMGNNVLFNNHSTLTCQEEIEIGDNSWFGEGVRLYDHSHKYKQRGIPFTSQGYSHGKIKIGSNVWVGSNTVILQNVSIGDGCVIGANNVIYKSLAPNNIVKSRAMEDIDIIK